MEDKVIVGVDGSEASLRAVDWAAAEARRRGYRLSMLMGFAAPTPESAFVWPEREIEESAQAALGAAEERVAAVAPGLATDRVVAMEAPTSALLHHSEDAALAVVGQRGRGGFQGLRVGSVTYRLATRSLTPVVVVGPGTVAEGRTGVVVGEDGSAASRQALAEAFQAAAAEGEEVRVVRALSPPVLPLVPTRAFHGRDATDPGEERALEEVVAPLRSRYPSVTVRTEVVGSRPSTALVNAAENARLLVMGASGRYGPSRFALGSTTHRMLHHSPCPVMVVHDR